MKLLSVICVVFFLAVSQCSGQSLENITKIAYIKQSRGLVDKVSISKDSVQGMVENHRAAEKSRQYTSAIDGDEWAKLLLTLKDVSLQDIDGLQSPTMDRAHDGALHSNIEITFEDGKTISHGFDDENPHPDLKPLLDALINFKQ